MLSARFVTASLAALVAAAALSSACAPDAASQAKEQGPATGAAALPSAPAASDVQTVRIPVEGMSCVACAARIKKTLTAMDGVKDVEVHLGERNARVEFDARRVTPERLAATIKDLGYSAGMPVLAER